MCYVLCVVCCVCVCMCYVLCISATQLTSTDVSRVCETEKEKEGERGENEASIMGVDDKEAPSSSFVDTPQQQYNYGVMIGGEEKQNSNQQEELYQAMQQEEDTHHKHNKKEKEEGEEEELYRAMGE